MAVPIRGASAHRTGITDETGSRRQSNSSGSGKRLVGLPVFGLEVEPAFLTGLLAYLSAAEIEVEQWSEEYGPGQIEVNLRYRPVEQGQAQCVYAFGTDPQVARDHLVLLQDDKQIFEAATFQGFPVLNAAYLRDAPASLTRTIEKVDALLTPDAVRELNAKVILDKQDPSDVAEEFLKSRGLI